MNTTTAVGSVDPSGVGRYAIIAGIAASIAMAAGGLVLVGWLLGIRLLTSLMPDYATMKVNTAFCFVLAGLSLWLLQRPSSRAAKLNPKCGTLGQICGVLVAVVGLLTLGEYCLRLNLGIDEALLRDTWTDVRISPPGRMSIATAFGFFILGSSLFFLGRKRTEDAIASQILALSALVAAVFAYFGYVYGVHGTYAISLYTTMAVHTASVFLVLCVAILFARPDRGLISAFTSAQSGGQVARMILPLAVTLPFFIGWVRLKGEQAGLYEPAFGIALFATLNIILFTILVWIGAKLLNTRTAELVQSTHRYRFLADAVPQIVWTAKPDGYIDYANKRWCDYSGMTIEQTKDWGWSHVLHPDDLQNAVERWTNAFSTASDYEVEYRFKRASDGVYRWHLGRAFPLRNQDGDIIQWVGTCTDIDDQKRAHYELEKRVAERSVELTGAREKLQGVLDAATHLAIIATDTKGIITVFNRGAEQMLGYTSDEIVGKQSPAIFHLESEIVAKGRELTKELGTPVQGFDVFVEKARRGQHGKLEWTYVQKDGKTFTVNLVVTASYDTNGSIVGFLGVATDVTARARAEKELKKTRERLEAILSTSLDGVIFYEAVRDEVGALRDLRFALVNSAAEKLTGRTASQLLGRTALEEYPQIVTNGLFDKFTRIIEENLALEFEHHSLRTDPPRWYRIAGVKLGDGIAMSYSDITARKQSEDQLKNLAGRLGLATQAMRAGIWDWDVRTGLCLWDEKMHEIYGLPKNLQITYGIWEKAVLPEDLAQAEAAIQSVIASKSQGSVEFRITLPNGSLRYVYSAHGVVLNDAEEVIRVVGVNIDVTEHKEGQEALRLSEERFSSAFEYAAIGMALVSLDGRWLKVNQALCDLIGYSAEELSGKTFQEIAHPEDLEADRVKMRQLLDGEINFCKVDQRFFHKEGRMVWALVSVSLLRDKQSKPLYLISQIEDITEIKEAMTRQRELTKKAQAAERAKSDFLAVMSHEIRTPMNGVIGMTGLLLDTGLNAEQRTLAETIRTSGESLLSLLNDILDFSKIEAGHLSIEELNFDLRKVVEDTLEMLAGQAQAKGIELVGGVDPEVPTNVRGDPGRVQQVLTNLVGNAIKFTTSGEVAIQATAKAETETELHVRFEIKDTGIGIPPETQARLFQPFVQADSSTSRAFGGTGLGLAICKRLAESMKGSIGVQSTPGEGSTFWVTLRLERQVAADIQPQDLHEFVDTRVLIVDDNETSRQFLHKQIIAWRLRNGCAMSGEQALAMLHQAVAEKAPYPVAIIDSQMPDMDGLALVRKINADPLLRETRLILLTPFGKPIPSDELETLKISDCCVKPARQSALFDSIIRLLSRSANTGAFRQPEPLMRPAAPRSFRKERILVADDNSVNQQVALGNLRKLGYNADLAANGFEVLKALERKRYNIILMDCQMPDLDGYEATKEIRRRERGANRTWIIAMTANVMAGDREKCLAAGMDDYVSKPLHRAELNAALERGAVRTEISLDDCAL